MTKKAALLESVKRYGKAACVSRDNTIDPNFRYTIGLRAPGNAVVLLGNGNSWERALEQAEFGYERFKKVVKDKTGKEIVG